MKEIKYTNILFFVTLSIATITAFFYFDWRLFLGGVIIWRMLSMGLAVSHHRLLTHRSFKTSKVMEWLITIWGNFASQGGHIFWIATHRKHHKHVDGIGDPHSPRDGLIHSHIGWMLIMERSLRDDKLLTDFAPDLLKQRFHRGLNKIWWLPATSAGLVILYFWGMVPVLWLVFFPLTMCLFCTWLVNSYCHYKGKRQFDTDDDSTNSGWVAWLTSGEGWHNNHHAHPSRARYGIVWWQIDTSWYFIWLLQKLRLAYAVKA